MGAVAEAHRRGQQQSQGLQGAPAPANSTGNMQAPPIDLSSILESILPQPGMATDPLPRPVPTQNIPDPPVNDLYRQMVQREDDAISVSSDVSLGHGKNKVMISPNPKSGRNVIKLV